MSREESRLAKVVDIRRWREEKARPGPSAPTPAPPPEPPPRGLALTLGSACIVFGLGLAVLPVWALAGGIASRFSLALLFGVVLPAGLGLTLLGVDLIVRTCRGRAGEGWYLRRVGLRRRKPSTPGQGEPPRLGKWPRAPG